MNFIMSTRYITKNKVMYTDTDSLIYHRMPRCVRYMKRDINKFDTNDYPTDNAYDILTRQ